MLILPGSLCLWLLVGCGKPAGESSTASAAAPPSVAAEPASPPAGPKADEKICFACKGTGSIKCMAGCVDGKVDCPGNCLRLNRGVWVHMDVPGHPATDLWQKFTQPDGSYTAYTQGHVGHVIALRGGKAEDTGPCPVCGGTTKVTCKICKGTGSQVCLICEGKKFVPIAWSPMDNPWLNRQSNLIRLTDGRAMLGKVVSTVGEEITIRTQDGKFVHVKASDIVPKADDAAKKL